MHAIFFGLKRAYHGTLRITRVALAKMKLTAARFDMLYAIKQRRYGILQSALRRVLGVSRATASRMLISLEQLGFIRRSIYPHDKRKRLVELTNRGRFRIAVAYRQLALSGWAKLAVDSALCGEGSGYHWYDENDCLAATSAVDATLGRL